jgi:hypothetical protein
MFFLPVHPSHFGLLPIQSSMQNHPILPGLWIEGINLAPGINRTIDQIRDLGLQIIGRVRNSLDRSEIVPVESVHIFHLLSVNLKSFSLLLKKA